MADIRKYRGYIIPVLASESYLIRFPDFPELEIIEGKDALDPFGVVIERCCGKICDCIQDRMYEGMEPPIPQEPLPYKPSIDVQLDIDLIRLSLNKPKPVDKPN